MKRAKNITKKTWAFLLIVFVGLLVANQSLYRHTHEINGRLVTHAHPYDTSSNDEPAQTHQHTKAQIVFLNMLALLFPAFCLFFVTLAIPKPFKETLGSVIPAYSSPILIKQGRAPPVF